MHCKYIVPVCVYGFYLKFLILTKSNLAIFYFMVIAFFGSHLRTLFWHQIHRCCNRKKTHSVFSSRTSVIPPFPWAGPSPRSASRLWVALCLPSHRGLSAARWRPFPKGVGSGAPALSFVPATSRVAPAPRVGCFLSRVPPASFSSSLRALDNEETITNLENVNGSYLQFLLPVWRVTTEKISNI